MQLHEATYLVCMLIVHVVRNVGKITFEDKMKVLQLCFSLLRSVEDTLYRIYNCESKATLEYIAE
jgi:hypothetical protein